MTEEFIKLSEEYVTEVLGVNACYTCARYWKAGTCEAYPDGIPPEIMSGYNDHRSPFRGDNGLQYIAKD